MQYSYFGAVLVALAAALSNVSAAALHTRNEVISASNFARFDSEEARLDTQDPTPSSTRFTVINEGASRLGVWSEIIYPGARISPVGDPYRPETSYIMLEPGQSFQMWDTPDHQGAFRAYAGCDVNGNGCLGELGAVTKVEYTMSPAGHQNNVGINLSLGVSKAALLNLCTANYCSRRLQRRGQADLRRWFRLSG